MKRFMFGLIFLSMLVSACAAAPGAPATSEATGTPATTPTQELPTSQPTGLPTQGQSAQAEQAAVKALADELGIDAGQITVDSVEAVEWPDNCLGIVRIDALCAQGIVPGFRIVLEASGTQYEYHTNQDGSVAVKSPLPEAGAPVEAVRKALAEVLGINVEEIEVVTSHPVEWPDACLGVATPSVMCAQVVTPGYLIVLKANGKEYEYHTNADASTIQAGEVELSWHREGGIAGFCDDLVVFTTGEYQAVQCNGSGQPRSGILRETLSTEELAKYNAWVEKFDAVMIEMDDKATADSMKISLFLKGRGNAQPTEAEKQEMLAWVQALYAEMKTK